MSSRARFRPLAPRSGRACERGSALIETTVALMLFAVGAVAVLGTISYSFALDLTNRETALAMQAARDKLEEIRAQPLADVVVSYNADVADDPDGTATAPGDTFTVAGLQQVGSDPIGTVELPVDGSGDVVETLTSTELGMPRDLDGDALRASTPLDMADAVILPVVVRVRWDGATGERSLAYRMVLRR